MRRAWIFSAVTAAALGAYALILRLSAPLLEWHMASISHVFAALGAFYAHFAAPIAEVMAAALLFLVAITAARALINGLIARSFSPIKRYIAVALCIALPASALGATLWPLHADTSASSSVAYARAYDLAELENLIYALDEKLIAAEPEIYFDGLRMRLTTDKAELCRRAPLAYAKAGITDSAVSPKISAYPAWMDHFRAAGIFVPFTGEMLINPHDMDSALPFTVLHEIAHSLGALREDEANLMAFYAALGSGDAEFTWSACLTALGYALRTMRALDETRFYELRGMLSPRAINELDAQGVFSGHAANKFDVLADESALPVNAPYAAVLAQSGDGTSTANPRFARVGALGAYDGLTYLLLGGGVDAIRTFSVN